MENEYSEAKSSQLVPRLPGLSHLQFSVLDTLVSNPGGVSATKVREALKVYGEDRAGPKFYQMMQRLVKAGLVKSWSRAFDVGGGVIARTYYETTQRGNEAWQSTLDFYVARLKAHQPK